MVPLPAVVEMVGGSHFEWPAAPSVAGADEGARAALRLALESQDAGAGRADAAGRGHGATNAADIHLVQRNGQPESYRIEIDDNRIQVTSSDEAGFFYAGQTLAQLRTSGMTPAMIIEDGPRFGYRGMHLDVGRHFFDVAFVKRYLDLMARFKMNRFHWHLTEDQGWRMEINAYPKLTEIGSVRSETILEKNFNPFVGDGIPHSGFYTQDEIREVVAYAAERHIEVIPEIEMPGHAQAALAAYPELACAPGPYEVSTVWGIHEDVFCPSEEVFEFLETVLGEVLPLFPSEFVHIGADEVPKRRWEESELAQAVMVREGLADEEELQSYFVRRIERFLNDNGKRLIGWDEILEGGLAPNATVMSWRGTEGGIAAAKQGHDVIMSPVKYAYFDLYQGDQASEPIGQDWPGYGLDLETVYSFEPVPEELTADEARYVIGAQGNVWTEYIKTPEKVEYMILPRMLAMAEVVWSPAAARDWDGFRARLPARLRSLAADGYNLRELD